MKKLLAGVSLVALAAMGAMVSGAVAQNTTTAAAPKPLTTKQQEVKTTLLALQKEKAAAEKAGDTAKVEALAAQISQVITDSGLTEAQVSEVLVAVQEELVTETQTASTETGTQTAENTQTEDTPDAVEDTTVAEVEVPTPELPGNGYLPG